MPESKRVERRDALAARWLDVLQKVLVYTLAQHLHDGHIKAVDPEGGLIGVVGVAVPAPVRRQDKVAGVHRDRLTVDDRRGALALQHVAYGRRCVTV